MTTDAELANARYKRWADLVAEGNAQAVSNLYCTDFKMFPPNAPPIIGREGAKGFAEELIKTGTTVVTTSTDIMPGAFNTPEGGTFWDIGHFQMYTEDKENPSLDGMYKRWAELVSDGNAQGVADMYCTDFKMFPPNAPPIIGREGAKVYAEELIKSGTTVVTTSTDIMPGAFNTPVGGTFWDIGHFQCYTEDKENPSLDGIYTLIWKNVNGTFLFYREVWNVRPGN